MFVIYLLSLFYTNFLQKKRQIFFFKFELYKNRISSIINLDNKTRGSLYMKKNIKHFLFLAAAAGTGIHLMNRTVNRTACMKEILSSHPGHYYDWKHGRIYYTKTGSGAPLLLIHDLHPASSSYEWSRMMKKLEKTNTVYTIDLLGCGRSDKPNITYTNYLYVQLIDNFIKDVIKEKTDVVATGSSVSFTVMACNMEKNLFKKIILINPEEMSVLNRTPDKKKNVAKFLLDLPVIGTFLYNTKVHELKINRMFREKYYYKKQLISTKAQDVYFEAAHLGEGAGRYLYASIISDYTNISITHALKNIENKICIIGSRERPHSVEILDEYTECNHNIETAYLSNSKYLPQLETPDKVNEILQVFLNNQ